MKDQNPPRRLSITIDDNGIHVDATHVEDLAVAIEAAQRMTALHPVVPSRGASRVPGKNHDAHEPASSSMRVLSSCELLDDDLGPFSPETAADRRARRQLSLLDDDWLVEYGRGLEIEDIKARAAALASDSLEGGADNELDDALFDPADPQTAALLRHEAHIRSLIGPDDDDEWEEEMDGDDALDAGDDAIDGWSPASLSADIQVRSPSTRIH